MCRQHFHTVETRMAVAEGAYEGETVRLDTQREGREARRESGRHGHFPWWTLWLIWPLVGLVKWLVPVLLGAIAAAAGALSHLPAPAFGPWPILLIVAGIILLRRR